MMLSKEIKKKKRAANIEIPQNSNESTPLKKKKKKLLELITKFIKVEGYKINK